jgi:LmbE family N-acetylglucosaminyl deacetylase
MKILIIVAHPDDEILGMGGTILNHTKKGDDVTIVYLTTGIASRRSSNYNNSPSYKLSKNESIKIKKQILELQNDAKNSSKILGVKKTIFFDYPDNELDTVPLLKIIKTIEEIVSSIMPDRIYTSHFADLNVDHRTVFEAILTACRPTGLPVKEIICFEILSSTEWTFSYDFKPNYFINIEKELTSKIKAMKIYKNEIRKFPHPRSIENIKISAKRWGTVCGFNAAEAFQIIRKFEE